MQTNLNFIGHIKTPYKSLADCPNNIQFDGPLCELRVDEAYQHELRGLEEGAHIMVLYWLRHPESNVNYSSVEEEDEPGVFALRTPLRPNPIGVAVLPIKKITAGKLFVHGLDCLDGTGLIDIKPAIYREL